MTPSGPRTAATLLAAVLLLASCSEPPNPPECLDSDGDGFGDPEYGTDGCDDPTPDCNDGDHYVFPGADELCDGMDNDCDGVVPADELDEDGDGISICGGDCDDTVSDSFPGAPELCDGIDNDCDGALPDDEADGDGDGYLGCADGPTGGDCDDEDDSVHPGADEGCDGADTDCDGEPGEEETDDDGDGYSECDGDCDDNDATSYSGAEEICDGLDNDCDGSLGVEEVDGDGDGYMVCDGPAGSPDCDDSDPSTYPGATEACDGIDNDCDGALPFGELDEDGDGQMGCQGDCDDHDASLYPGAPELCDARDNDCDGVVPADELDGDGDGYIACDECDDGNADVHPAASEVCNGSDDNCDGLLPDDEADGDGDGSMVCEGDCDDGDGGIHPGAQELCADGLDNDCDGTDNGCGPNGEILLANSDAKLTGEASEDYAGIRVTGAGDVNGDGYGDALVAAYHESSVSSCSGAVYVVAGPVSGAVGLAGSVTKFVGEAAWDYAGIDAAGGYDVNEDGLDDVLVGAYGDDTTGAEAGAVYLMLTPFSGTVALSGADAKIVGQAEGDRAGWAVALVDDGDGDGLPEILVGAPQYDGDGTDVGCAYLLHPPLDPYVELEFADTTFVGEASEDLAGRAVSRAGDVNGDGFDDLLVGAPENDGAAVNSGAAYLVYSMLAGEFGLGDIGVKLIGEAADDQAGRAVAPAGDVNGDGFDDVIVGAWQNDGAASDAGAAYLVNGPVAGALNLSAATAKFEGEVMDDSAGVSVDSGGDVNGDGFDDVIVGAYYNDQVAPGAGASYLLYGPLSGTIGLGAADARLYGEAGADNAGQAVAGVGDMNGDGFDDIMVGAPKHDIPGTDAGSAYLLLGNGM